MVKKCDLIVDEISFDSSICSFVQRVRDKKTGEIVRLTIAETLDDETNSTMSKIIKGTHTARIAFSSKNPNREGCEIITFNVPESKKAYRGIFDYNGLLNEKETYKIFSSTVEGKWKLMERPPKKVLDEFFRLHELLKSLVIPSKKEAPIIRL